MSPSPACPFCAIAHSYPPLPIYPSSTSTSNAPFSQAIQCSSAPLASSSTSSPKASAQVLLSTPDLIAFLDHAPISTGHVLLATRVHRVKISDVQVREGQAIGAWMGVLSRAIVGAVRDAVGEHGDGRDDVEGRREGSGKEGEKVRMRQREGKGVSADVVESGEDEMRGGDGVFEGDWNVVQNNGPRAAQVVPHVHFHIIPRTGEVPELTARSWTIFGRGIRGELDDDEATELVMRIRMRLGEEVRRVGVREGEEGLRGLGVGKDGRWVGMEEGRGAWRM